MSPCTHLSRDLGDPGQQRLLSASAWHLDMLTAHAVRPGHPGWTGALGFPSAGPPSLAGAPMTFSVVVLPFLLIGYQLGDTAT